MTRSRAPLLLISTFLLGCVNWNFDPDITVTFPGGGETFVIGTTVEFTWHCPHVDDVRIELSRDGGTTWETIVPTLATPPRRYVWTVTGPPSDECVLRVTDAAGTVFGLSGGAFSIVDAGGASVPVDLWTWVSGSSTADQPGDYGTKGSPDPACVPGGRVGSISWIDRWGDLWLFGGHGLAESGGFVYMNDLWRYDGTNWTWVSGTSAGYQPGVYGTRGVSDPANVPGARRDSTSWTDGNGNLWLFGGYGCDESGSENYLNDLWRYDGTNWTWTSGSASGGQWGVYGTKGTPDPANVPGARCGSVSWADGSGGVWLFGGNGRDVSGDGGRMNDLWRYDGANWTWVSGSSSVGQYGIYGSKGVPAPTNVPGVRLGSVSWTDQGGNLWLFGGYGFGATVGVGYMNDVWRYDGTSWTWMSGSSATNQSGTYGTKGVPDPANVPSTRASSVSWADEGGNLWLFGGFRLDGANVRLNDLWRYDGTNWTWVSGSSVSDEPGTYGTKDVPDPANVPGARTGSVSWIDGSGSFWLFGGAGSDEGGAVGALNDLWLYLP